MSSEQNLMNVVNFSTLMSKKQQESIENIFKDAVIFIDSQINSIDCSERLETPSEFDLDNIDRFLENSINIASSAAFSDNSGSSNHQKYLEIENFLEKYKN